MALIKCNECGKEYSDTLKKCPHCGYKEKKGIDKKYIIIPIVIVAVIVVVSGVILALRNANIGNQNIDSGTNNNQSSGLFNFGSNKYSNLSFKALADNKVALESLSEEKQNVVKYFDTNYYYLDNYYFNLDMVRSFDKVFRGGKFILDGVVKKIVKTTDEEYVAILYVTDPYYYNIDTILDSQNYEENCVIIKVNNPTRIYQNGEFVRVETRYSALEQIDIDGKSAILPSFVDSYMHSGLKFTNSDIEKVARELFGDDIKLRKGQGYIDSNYVDEGVGVGNGESGLMVATFNNQTNIDFKSFTFNQASGGFIEYTPERATADDYQAPTITKQIYMGRDFENFIVTTYDSGLKNLYIDYYNKDREKVWTQEYKSEGTNFYLGNSGPFDYNNDILAILIDNDLHIISLKDGKEVCSPVLVGTKNIVYMFNDKIVLIGNDNKDLIVEVSLKGEVLKRINGDVTVNEITGSVLQLINNKLVLVVVGYDTNYYMQKYKIFELDEDGNLDYSSEEKSAYTGY